MRLIKERFEHHHKYHSMINACLFILLTIKFHNFNILHTIHGDELQ